MSMTKAEKANVERLETDLAFRWPTEPEPSRSVRASSSGETVEGWDFNAWNSAITRMWSTSVNHGTFYDGKKSGDSQNGRPLYATERDALLALRWALCRKYAAELRIVDRRMEQAA